MRITALVQQVNIAEKIKDATDSSYQIGVIIGSFIPFVVLVGLAYWMYASAKKRDKNG
ncbi:hypothetical protein SAMN05443667_10969 [Flavobacterium gillisiae]|jgi:hypothetical protein|uniref:Uncharacterized protein n=1 Tax=Flavobacterium gillisiae TaxID=150146 RepID=A0A1H4E8Z9_9FLAO|nr:hypothetical protein [Flavobacterium gillisiae]SEA81515.1 hypothetical protein SAMN05443667_10969 [Flavobacterium gillisiae]|tara:strand:- start:71479 stop:71652 length:174 start_codon:yes stop_codon:yes gene_type:complete